MLLDALHKIANHRTSLTREEAREVMSQILRGDATDAQIAALLVALHMKGETVEEIVGFAQAIRDEAAPLQTEDGEAIDLSGTDGRQAGALLGRRIDELPTAEKVAIHDQA